MGTALNVGNITVASGTSVSFSANTGTFATGGAVRTIDVGAGGLFNLTDQSLSTSIGFVKNGSGTFNVGTVGGNYTGGFTLNSGFVVTRDNTALGSGPLILNGGAIAASGVRILGGFSGGIQIGGNIQVGALNATPGVSQNAGIKFTDNVSIGSATRILTVGGNATGNNTKYSFDGVISGASGAGLTFNVNSGATGSFMLGGANTYTGATTIAQGTLFLDVNGSIANSSNIIVGNAGSTGRVLDTTRKTGFTLGSAQTLSGIGTINVGTGKTLTINGTHAVGNVGTNNGVGIQTVTGNTAYSSGSIFSWDLASNKSSATGIRGTDFDGFTTSENLGVSTGAIFKIVFGGTTDINDSFWNSAQTWSGIFSAATTTGANGSSLFDTIRVFNGSTDITNSFTKGAFTFNGSTLQYSLVPEPTSAFVGLLLAAGLMRRSRSIPCPGPVS